MNFKKIAAFAAAAIIAGGFVPADTEYAFPLAVTAEAASGDFVIEDGMLIEYKGNAKNVTIPKEVISIGHSAFYDSRVESVKIHANVTSIMRGAFANCSLKTVTFEKGSKLTFIGDLAFFDCRQLECIDLTPCNDLEFMGFGVFYACMSLRTADLSGCTRLTEIGESTFSDCYELTSVFLPDSVTKIGDCAFMNCTMLKTLTVPKKAKVGKKFAGYMSGTDVRNSFSYDTYKTCKADGETTLYNYVYENPVGDQPLGGEKTIEIVMKQKPVTLYVAKGSDGERYAKNNGIKYKYGTAPALAAAPSELKATADKASVTLTWSKAKNAESYAVYMYSEKTKKYEKYKTVTGTKCTVTGLKAGTKYKFKVISYSKINGKNTQGNFSTVTVTVKK